jgi:DHA1 family tetracycline resistance protein-like MFS transporter
MGVIIGPLISGSLVRLFGAQNQVVVSFAARAAIAGATVLFLALRLEETLPPESRRPFTLDGVNPLGFLRLFRGSSTLRRLAIANGLSSMAEGKMTSDVNMAYIRNDVGFGPGLVTGYLTSWGVACFLSGKYLVRSIVKKIGPRRFTDISMGMTALSYWVLGLFPQGWAVWSNVALLTPGINNLAAAAIKSQAAAHAIAGGMGKGEFSASMASLRAVAFFLAPTLWGSIYAACVRAGQPPGFALVSAGLVGAALPALIHRSISAEDWQPSTK